MLSEAPDQTMRMTALAAQSNATLPRLSRVMTRLEDAGYVRRAACPGDRRATNVVLTDAGGAKVAEAAPGHVDTVRSLVVDVLSAAQLSQLGKISARLLSVLYPDHKMAATMLTTRDPAHS